MNILEIREHGRTDAQSETGNVSDGQELDTGLETENVPEQGLEHETPAMPYGEMTFSDLGMPEDAELNDGESEGRNAPTISPEELGKAEEEFAKNATSEASSEVEQNFVEQNIEDVQYQDGSADELDEAEKELAAQGVGSQDISFDQGTGPKEDEPVSGQEQHQLWKQGLEQELKEEKEKNRKKGGAGQIVFNILIAGLVVVQFVNSLLPNGLQGLFQKKSPNETDKTAATAITALSEAEKNTRDIQTQDARITQLEKQLYAQPEQAPAPAAPVYNYDDNTVIIPEASLDGLTQIENSDRAVANALGNGSEYLVRDSGEVAIIYQGDVNYAREKLGLDRQGESSAKDDGYDYRFDYSVLDNWPSDDNRPLRNDPDATWNDDGNKSEDAPADEQPPADEPEASIKAEDAPRDFSDDWFIKNILEKRAKAEKEVSDLGDTPADEAQLADAEEPEETAELAATAEELEDEDVAQIADAAEPAVEDTAELAAAEEPATEDAAEIAAAEEPTSEEDAAQIADATEPATEDTAEIAAAEEPAAEDTAELAATVEPENTEQLAVAEDEPEDEIELAADSKTENPEDATILADEPEAAPAPAPQPERATNRFAPYGFNVDGSVPFQYEKPVPPVSYDNTPEGALQAMAMLTSLHIR